MEQKATYYGLLERLRYDPRTPITRPEPEAFVTALKSICDAVIDSAAEEYKESIKKDRVTCSMEEDSFAVPMDHFRTGPGYKIPDWVATWKQRREVLEEITRNLEENINPALWDQETRSSIPGGSKKALVLQSIQEAILQKTSPKQDGYNEMVEAWAGLGFLLLALSRGTKPLDITDPLSTWILPIIGAFSQAIVQTLDARTSVAYTPGDVCADTPSLDFHSTGQYFRLQVLGKENNFNRPPGRPGLFSDYAPQDEFAIYGTENEFEFYRLLSYIVSNTGPEVYTLIQTIVDVWLDIALYHEVIPFGSPPSGVRHRVFVHESYGRMRKVMYSVLETIEDSNLKHNVSYFIHMLLAITLKAVYTLDIPFRFFTTIFSEKTLEENKNSGFKSMMLLPSGTSRVAEMFFGALTPPFKYKTKN